MFLILYLFIQDTIGNEYPRTQCNPYSSPMEKCPNGEYCIRHHLECTEEYCLCPSTYHEDHGETHHADHAHEHHHEEHIAINVFPLTHGHREDHHHHEAHHENHEDHHRPLTHGHREDHHEAHEDHHRHGELTHCDPWSSPLQQCPNGEYCFRQHLECNDEYCICDHYRHGEVTHCDPWSSPLQQCPNGEYCFRQHLECNDEYCICDHYRHGEVTHCDPWSSPLQQCPNGEYCFREHLECNDKYCVCPSHHYVPHGSSSEGQVTHGGVTHCDPFSVPLQQCPNGEYCFSAHLQCNDKYCLCPSHHHVPHGTTSEGKVTHGPHGTSSEGKVPHGGVTHCDPFSVPLQQCPNGEYCFSAHLQCNDEYCVCPSNHYLPHDKDHGHHVPLDEHHGHHVSHDGHHGEVAHCDPWTSPLQQCPNGDYCLRQHLECNDEYCHCP